jgi:hypothetical protein
MTPTVRTRRLNRPDLVMLEHTLPVPLDHADPRGEQIEIRPGDLAAFLLHR